MTNHKTDEVARNPNQNSRTLSSITLVMVFTAKKVTELLRVKVSLVHVRKNSIFIGPRFGISIFSFPAHKFAQYHKLQVYSALLL